MVTPIRIGERTFEPGTKGVVAVPVTTELHGNMIQLYVHVAAGSKPGPALALLSTTHGSEFLPNAILRRLMRDLDPAGLCGTVLAVPVGNPVALQTLTRNTRDESDAPDLNRVFPGEYNSITEQLAHSITENVLKKATHLMDFHFGHWAAAMGEIMFGADMDQDVSDKSREMAFAFGYPCVQAGKMATHFPGPRSATGYASKVLRMPSIVVELGGAGFDHSHEEGWIEKGLQGIQNVMILLEMLQGQMKLPDRYLLWQKRWRVNPSVGGYLLPQIPRNSLLREVKKGEVLAKVVSPYTFEVLEELTPPGDGVIMYTARDYPVRPGDWAYGVVDLNDSNTQWIDNPLMGR